MIISQLCQGSELKLLKGLELGCDGIITATCNVTANLSRKVYDDFNEKKQQTTNEILCKVRGTFDQYNLISGLHSFMSDQDESYKNVIPPISLLNEKDKKQLLEDLGKLNFTLESLKDSLNRFNKIFNNISKQETIFISN